MPNRPLARARLLAQGLVTRPYVSPLAAVRAFGLMQGQEPTVFSSVALRTADVSMEALHASLDAGELVRAYPMRGTVFLATAEDMAWLSELCAGPSYNRTKERCRKVGADEASIERVTTAFIDAPTGLTQEQFRELVAREIPGATSGTFYMLRYLLMISGVAVYAGSGQLITPAAGLLGPGLEQRFNGDRDAGVLELATRYLRTHGPADMEDFAWWSKLPKAEIRRAFAALPPDLEVDEHGRWARIGLQDEVCGQGSTLRQPHLLPPFDEYILGYRDRMFAMSEDSHARLVPRNMGIFRKAVVVDGVVRGSWQQINGKLQLEDYAGIPAYAEPGIRRRFREFPGHRI
ncbi:winged helix DNA-binding domain-containing protein [Corynebacterium sp. A21]|uniref:winged helix DNA-binding domain-containing protein n=1 Tax=Corynebacterium sp. A21 TaxID=3457318 RepID=UPI003FD1DCC5